MTALRFSAECSSVASNKSRFLMFEYLQNSFWIDTEAGRSLTRRIVSERLHELYGQNLSFDAQVDVVYHPIVILVGSDVRPFIGIHAKVVEFRNPQTGKWIHPDHEVSGRALFAENVFPIVVPHGHQQAVVVEVVELPARRLGFLAYEVGQYVVAIQMDLVNHATRTSSGQQSLLD